jgi:cell division protein FtsX
MRLLRYALNNIKRSLLLSISSIVVISLMTFLIFALFFTEFVMRSLAESVNSRLSLTLNVKSGFSSTSREVVDTLANLERIAPGIAATFASSQDNFEVLKARDPELAKIIDDESQNPLPSTISVKNVPIEQYEALDRVILQNTRVLDINQEKHAKSVINYRNQFERIRIVISVLYSLRFGLYCIIAFFLFSVFVVIFHSIGNAVFFFSEEIRITQLVGGQKRYIYGPFVIQGIIYSALAILLS